MWESKWPASAAQNSSSFSGTASKGITCQYTDQKISWNSAWLSYNLSFIFQFPFCQGTPTTMSGLVLENFWANKAACDDAERAYYEKLSGCKVTITLLSSPLPPPPSYQWRCPPQHSGSYLTLFICLVFYVQFSSVCFALNTLQSQWTCDNLPMSDLLPVTL